MTKNKIYQTALYNTNKAIKRLSIRPDIIPFLTEAREKIEITINPIMPDGKVKSFKAFLVRHNDTLGPSKGGIRMNSGVTIEDITGLAMEMTWKTSLIGVPFGGGKSGICCDSIDLSPQAKEIVIRGFTRGMLRQIGPEIYVPAPDMGTNQNDMGYISDCISYSHGVSITDGCFVTGKPDIMGGILGRKEATGKGVVYSVEQACKKLGINIKKATVSIQGFGNVGSVAAKDIQKVGAKVIAVSDITGGFYSRKGLDIDKMVEYASQNGTLNGFDTAEKISPTDVLEVDCDILIPAAAGSQITLDNVNNVKTKLIAEGANAPILPEADEILAKKGIFIIPDILCNSGGVFVSYLEYTQETQREQISQEVVEERLRKRIALKFEEVYQYANQHNVSMRMAAMDISVNRVVEGINARGLFP